MSVGPNATHQPCPRCQSVDIRVIPDVQPGMLHCQCLDCGDVWVCAERAPDAVPTI
jgi:hypothetical protein